MTDCLICKTPSDPALGYSMGMMGWVCSDQCRDKYNSLLETIFKDKEPKPMEKTFVEKVVAVIMNKANAHRTEAGELDQESKECVFKATELEEIAKEISMLGTKDEL
ncbi:MAG: hypothetical protein QQN63_05560 [Nitrosopumilus sp.]